MNHEALIKRRDELRQRLEAIRRDLGQGLDADLEEQAQQLENYDTLMEIARVAEQELSDIEAALGSKNSG
jgi:phage regulator Rha-like protein